MQTSEASFYLSWSHLHPYMPAAMQLINTFLNTSQLPKYYISDAMRLFGLSVWILIIRSVKCRRYMPTVSPEVV